MESFATPYPVVYHDGEQEHDKGVVGIHSVLSFKRFQFLISQKTGLPATQLSSVFVCRRTSGDPDKRQKLPINENTNFNILLNQHNPSKEKDCHFLVVQKKSKKERKGPRRRQVEPVTGDDEDPGSQGDAASSDDKCYRPDSSAAHLAAGFSSPSETAESSPASSLPPSPHPAARPGGHVKDLQVSPMLNRSRGQNGQGGRAMTDSQRDVSGRPEGESGKRISDERWETGGVDQVQAGTNSSSTVKDTADAGYSIASRWEAAVRDSHGREAVPAVEPSWQRGQALQTRAAGTTEDGIRAEKMITPADQMAGPSRAGVDDVDSSDHQARRSPMPHGMNLTSWQQMQGGEYQVGQKQLVLGEMDRPGSAFVLQERIQRQEGFQGASRDTAAESRLQQRQQVSGAGLLRQEHPDAQNEKLRAAERGRDGKIAVGVTSVPVRRIHTSAAGLTPNDPATTLASAGRRGGANGLFAGSGHAGLSAVSISGSGNIRGILRSSGGLGVIGPRTRATAAANSSVGVIGPKQADVDQPPGASSSLFANGTMPAGKSPYPPNQAQSATSQGPQQPSLVAIQQRAVYHQEQAEQGLLPAQQYRGLSPQDLQSLNVIMRGLAAGRQQGSGQRICKVCHQHMSNPAASSTFHWCVDDRVVVGFRGPSPAGPIQRPLKRHVETAA